MSKITLSGNASGSAVFTVQAPATNTNRTLALPDADGDVLLSSSNLTTQVKSATSATGEAPIYAARAWVNFNGTGTVAIRAAGNVSSITDRGTGSYRVNLTTAMLDTNYAVAVSAGIPLSNLSYASFAGDAPTTSTFDLQTVNTNAMTTLADPSYVSAVVYR